MTNDKSPLHPSALRIRDLHPGRRVIRFNLAYGIMARATIVNVPRVVETAYVGRCLKLNLRSDSGNSYEHFMEDLGVIPYQNFWNPTNFIIDARKEHLLPGANGSLRRQIELSENRDYDTYIWDLDPYIESATY